MVVPHASNQRSKLPCFHGEKL
jgi:hypothetical protein